MTSFQTKIQLGVLLTDSEAKGVRGGKVRDRLE